MFFLSSLQTNPLPTHNSIRRESEALLISDCTENEEFSIKASKTRLGLCYKAQGKEEMGEDAISTMLNHGSCYEEGSSPSLLASLKICTKEKDLNSGCKIHDDIVRRGLLKGDAHLGSALVNMYAKCGALVKAQEVFDGLRTCNRVSWNALIAGYVQNGYGEEAMNRFELMQLGGLTPDAATYTSILKACSLTGAVDKGQELHARIVHNGLLELNNAVANALVDMYAKCGLLAEAQGVFDKLTVRDVVSWSALISGYVQHMRGEEALLLFERMQHEGFSLDAVAFLCALKACCSMEAVNKGQEIHSQIIREGVFDRDNLVGTTLLDMYAKCGLLAEAHAVFDTLLVRSIVPWTALMTGYVQHGLGDEALDCFKHMQGEGLFPNADTFACILKACGISRAACRGQEIHGDIVKDGLLERDLVVGTALLDMYTNCGALLEAREVFDELPFRNVFSWNALISGYARHGHGEAAVSCFERMQVEGFSPDAITFACVLKACAGIGARNKGQEAHAEILRYSLFETNILVANALVDMYAKCGFLEKAQLLFDQLRKKDIVSCNALGAGYIQHELYEKALTFFECMQLDGFAPDSGTFIWTLKACSGIGAAHSGRNQHARIVREGWLEKDVTLGTTLIEMYCRCGLLVEAQEVFDTYTAQDVFSWNALIDGYAQFGKDEAVFNLFDTMAREGKEPDIATFALVLNTCSHSGLLSKGQSYFEILSTLYGIHADLQHYTCIIDLFGRAGCLDKAVAVMEKITVSIDQMVWHAVLGACQKWKYARLGEWAFGRAAQMNEMDVVAYVCLSNIYSSGGKREEDNEMDDMDET